MAQAVAGWWVGDSGTAHLGFMDGFVKYCTSGLPVCHHWLYKAITTDYEFPDLAFKPPKFIKHGQIRLKSKRALANTWLRDITNSA